MIIKVISKSFLSKRCRILVNTAGEANISSKWLGTEMNNLMIPFTAKLDEKYCTVNTSI